MGHHSALLFKPEKDHEQEHKPHMKLSQDLGRGGGGQRLAHRQSTPTARGSAAGRREGGQVPGSLGSQGEQVGSALEGNPQLLPYGFSMLPGTRLATLTAHLSREHSTLASGWNPDAGKFQAIIDITNIPAQHQHPLWSPGLPLS